MLADQFDSWLQSSVAEVMEAMCFLSTEGDAVLPVEDGKPWVGRKLSFSGPYNGYFGVRAPLATARVIACNFLGEDEDGISVEQSGEIVGEIANMVCGSVLARLESTHSFDLTSPEVDETVGGCIINGLESVNRIDGTTPTTLSADAYKTCRTFPIEEGILVVWLEIEPS